MKDIEFQMERVLTFKQSGKTRQGKASVGGVKFDPKEGKWTCRVSTDYLWQEPAWVQGEDPLDAFRTCLFVLSELILGNTENGWSVWWKQEGDHGDFMEYV
jgi:hypothetical protein